MIGVWFGVHKSSDTGSYTVKLQFDTRQCSRELQFGEREDFGLPSWLLRRCCLHGL